MKKGYRVSGVDRKSRREIDWFIRAKSAENAAAKAELDGVLVTDVEELEPQVVASILRARARRYRRLALTVVIVLVAGIGGVWYLMSQNLPLSDDENRKSHQVVRERAPAPIARPPSLAERHADARDVGALFGQMKTNEAAFKQRFEGQTMKVIGKVNRVTDVAGTDRITVELRDRTDGPLSLNFDTIFCQFSEGISDALARVEQDIRSLRREMTSGSLREQNRLWAERSARLRELEAEEREVRDRLKTYERESVQREQLLRLRTGQIVVIEGRLRRIGRLSGMSMDECRIID